MMMHGDDDEDVKDIDGDDGDDDDDDALLLDKTCFEKGSSFNRVF